MKLLQSLHRLPDKVQHLNAGSTGKVISVPGKNPDITLHDLGTPLGQRLRVLLSCQLNHIRAMVYPAGPLYGSQDHVEHYAAPAPNFEEDVLRLELQLFNGHAEETVMPHGFPVHELPKPPGRLPRRHVKEGL
jgi:hypothetical protein